MINNLAILTYTHSNMRDVWPMYFGELNKYMSFIKNHYILSDTKFADLENKNVFIYNDNEPFYIQIEKCLKEIKEDYILLMFEDEILYDYVDPKNIERYLSFLNKNEEYCFLRLIKSDAHYVINLEEDIYLLDNATSTYVFSTQPSVWRKKDLLKISLSINMNSFKDELIASKFMKKENLKGVYVYNNEPAIGRQHYESKTFPVMEVIGKGWWIMYYPDKMEKLFKQYGINPSIRGRYYNL